MRAVMRATARGRRGGLALLLLLAAAPASRAQSVTDGSEAALGAETAGAVLALIGRALPRGEAGRVSGLRRGRAGALCGAIDRPNRMGTYTGDRGFVADLAAGFAGLLPEGPELRNPASPDQYRAMERALSLYRANCAQG